MVRTVGGYPSAHGFVAVPEGRLYWRSLGRSALPTLLAIHGGPTEHGYLGTLADLVPHGYRIVWYDQLGCGRSTRPRSYAGYGPERAAEHVERVAAATVPDRPILFGHSWGGAVALAALAHRSQHYRALVVSGGFASDASFQRAMRLHVRGLPVGIRRPIEAGERRGRYDTTAYRAAFRRRRREYSWRMQVLPFELAATEARLNRPLLRTIYGERPGLLSPPSGTLAGWDVRDRLRGVRAPALVLAGELEAGRFTAREIHRLLPHSRLVLLPDAAHLPFLQVRDRFMTELLGFLRSAAPTPRPLGARHAPE